MATGIRKVLRGAALVADAGNDARPEAADVPSGADKTIATILGEIVWLMSQSSEFKQYLISDLEWLVMPPILLRQFRLFYHEGRPVAVVLYARISPELQLKLDAESKLLKHSDWKCGPICRIIEVIAPFGGDNNFAEETKQYLNVNE